MIRRPSRLRALAATLALAVAAFILGPAASGRGSPGLALAAGTTAAPANPLAQKPYLLSDSPLEGIAVIATFRYHLMWAGIKTLTIADVWGAQAVKAGLRNGDRILKIQGKPVDGMNVIIAKWLIDPVGRKPSVPLEILHLNATQSVRIDLPRGPQGGKA
jgi:membrane-associated protease RseP (regulator of RpoE activity)